MLKANLSKNQVMAKYKTNKSKHPQLYINDSLKCVIEH